MEVFGFPNEFYAIRFLHQVVKTQYPDEVGEIPQLPSKQEKRARGMSKLVAYGLRTMERLGI